MAPDSSETTTQPINHPAFNLLKRAHSPTRATQLFTDKVKNKPLLLAPSNTEAAANQDKRSLRRHIRLRKKQYHLQHAKPRPLSANEKRQLHLHDLAPEEIKYDLYRGLNRMWTGYILEVLNLTDSNGDLVQGVLEGATTVTKQLINVAGHGSLIASADFHGMNIEIVRCVDVGRVGLKGIVVRETRSTLVIVTSRDKAVRVLKKGAVFRVVVDLDGFMSGSRLKSASMGVTGDDVEMGGEEEHRFRGDNTEDLGRRKKGRDLVFELQGSQLEIRPVERAVKKFKWHNINAF